MRFLYLFRTQPYLFLPCQYLFAFDKLHIEKCTRTNVKWLKVGTVHLFHFLSIILIFFSNKMKLNIEKKNRALCKYSERPWNDLTIYIRQHHLHKIHGILPYQIRQTWEKEVSESSVFEFVLIFNIIFR